MAAFVLDLDVDGDGHDCVDDCDGDDYGRDCDGHAGLAGFDL